MRKAVAAGLFGLVLTLIPALPAHASVSAQDQATLTSSFQKLSLAWSETDSALVFPILGTPSYTQEDWEQYFTGYFAANPYTDPLREYLTYPVFFWHGETTRLKLQAALSVVLWSKIQETTVQNGSNLGQAMAASSGLKQTIFNCHIFFDGLVRVGVVPSSVYLAVFNNYKSYILQFPAFFGTSPLTPQTMPYIGLLRAQVQLNLISYQEFLVLPKAEISQTLSLNGARLDLWNDLTFLVIDNNGLDSAQLDVLRSLLVSIPPTIHRLRAVTVNDFLTAGETRGLQSAMHSPNIFGFRIGVGQDNSFPADVQPSLTDTFSIVVAHEFNHAVDFLASSNPPFSNRKAALISQTGNMALQYLRSMFEGTFFQQFPQEFVASISNEYFANSKRTLELGIQRFTTGVSGVTYKQPINQFLVFADLYSAGGTQVPFYVLNTAGQLTTTFATITRNGLGHINSLTYQGETWGFGLDTAGNVTAITPPTPATQLSASTVSFTTQLVGTASPAQSLTLTNNGTGPLTISSIMAGNEFSQTNNCPGSLPIGANCMINVTFSPLAFGPRSGSVSVATNAPGSPQAVTVSGFGDFRLSLQRPRRPLRNSTGQASVQEMAFQLEVGEFSGPVTLGCHIPGSATPCLVDPIRLRSKSGIVEFTLRITERAWRLARQKPRTVILTVLANGFTRNFAVPLD